MKVAIGTDHNGPALKEEIINKLSDIAEFIDCSPVNDPLDDYPDFAYKVSEMVVSKKADLGILICGTGVGMSIAANKFKGIRASLCSDCYSAEMTRRHNNSNILCLGARVLGIDLAKRIVDTYIDAPFEGGRHLRRLNKITDIENEE